MSCSIRIVVTSALAVVWCLILIGFRVHYTESRYYVFLVWNLFLAAVPLVFSNAFQTGLSALRQGILRPALLGLALGAWLIFFPNAPYLLTDLIHLHKGTAIPMWYDLLMLLSFGVTGVFLGLVSLRQIHGGLLSTIGPFAAGLCVGLALFLSAFGIYLGRFLRWNSWDILTEPLALGSDLTDRLIHPLSHPRTIGVTVGFGVLLVIGYLMSRAFSEPTQRARPR